jgi:glycosyltransferase involved in cell wall biosynthesis
MRLALVAPDVGDPCAGIGVAVGRLAIALAEQGHEVRLLCLDGPGVPAPDLPGVQVRRSRLTRLAPGWVWGADLGAQADWLLAGADVAQAHGFWTPPLMAICARAARHGTPLCLSPHGALTRAALAYRPRLKRAALLALKPRVLDAASALHATSEAEAADLSALGLAAPVEIIPHGVAPHAGVASARSGGARRLLFLSRLHPKKGLDLLLRAWARLAPTHPDWQLDVAGPDEEGRHAAGHGAAMRALARALDLPRVRFLGPATGAAKDELMAGAALFVLPSRGENFGLVAGEALAAGVPVVTTTETAWNGLAADGCGWSVPPDLDALAAALADAMGRPPAELAAMGAKGRALVETRFGWDRAARAHSALFESLVTQNRRDRPPPAGG